MDKFADRAFRIVTNHPNVLLDDEPLDPLINEIAAAIKAAYGLRYNVIRFGEALDAVQKGFDQWKDKPHNAKWFRRIDGTPIPNDLCVCIAEAIVCASVSWAESEQRDRVKCSWCGAEMA